MKKQILSFVLGAVVALALTMVPAVADSISKSIDVFVDYVTVTLDGEEVEVKNFVHEGSTYLGLRDMGNLLGLQVDWDEKTHTAVLTSPGKTPVFPSSEMQTIDVPVVKETTMTINGVKVDPKYITDTYNAYKETYTSITDEQIKEAITSSALWKTFKDEMFKKYDLKNTDEQKAEAEKSYDEYVESYGGEEAFELVLAANKYTPEQFKEEYINGYLEQLLMTPLTENLEKNSKEIQDFKAEKKAEFEKDKSLAKFPVATVKHILIPEGDGAEDEAKAVLAKLKKGEKFDKVLEEYKENDPGMPDTGYKVYIGSGFVPEFEEAAVKLTKGKFSDVVKSSYGYHILYCLEKSETITFDQYFEMNYSAEVSQMLDNIVTEYEKNAVVEVDWGF